MPALDPTPAPSTDEPRPEPLYLNSRESAAKVNRLFAEFETRQAHALAVLDDPGLTRLERAWLATKILQVLAGYRGRKPREGDAGRPAIPGVAVAVMARRAQDLRTVVEVDGPAAGLDDAQVRHEVVRRLDLSWERLRQILTGELGAGAARRRAKSDRPAGRPRRTGSVPVPPASQEMAEAAAGQHGAEVAFPDEPHESVSAPVAAGRGETVRVDGLVAGLRSRD